MDNTCRGFTPSLYLSPSINNSCIILQGSAKLEKAEILQMTVDHLKVLHQKGKDAY